MSTTNTPVAPASRRPMTPLEGQAAIAWKDAAFFSASHIMQLSFCFIYIRNKYCKSLTALKTINRAPPAVPLRSPLVTWLAQERCIPTYADLRTSYDSYAKSWGCGWKWQTIQNISSNGCPVCLHTGGLVKVSQGPVPPSWPKQSQASNANIMGQHSPAALTPPQWSWVYIQHSENVSSLQ